MKDFVIVIFLIIFNHCENCVFIYETDCVVHVSVCIVTNDAIIYPKDLFLSVIFLQIFLNFFLRKMRISVFIKQTRFRSQNRSSTVEFNGTAFHYNSWIKNRKSFFFSDFGRNHIIQFERRIFSTPRVETPINNDFLWFFSTFINQKSRTVISAPRVIRFVEIKFDFGNICASFGDMFHCESLHFLIFYIDANKFTFRKFSDEFGVSWID